MTTTRERERGRGMTVSAVTASPKEEGGGGGRREQSPSSRAIGGFGIARAHVPDGHGPTILHLGRRKESKRQRQRLVDEQRQQGRLRQRARRTALRDEPRILRRREQRTLRTPPRAALANRELRHRVPAHGVGCHGEGAGEGQGGASVFGRAHLRLHLRQGQIGESLE